MRTIVNRIMAHGVKEGKGLEALAIATGMASMMNFTHSQEAQAAGFESGEAHQAAVMAALVASIRAQVNQWDSRMKLN